jgi:hypothetical protein
MNVEVHAIGPLLLRTINSIESLYGLSSSRWSADWDGKSLVFGRAEVLKEELLELWNSPDRPSLELLARLVWESAAIRRHDTVWLIRKYSPEASLILLLCVASGVPTETVLKADLSESQFLRLTSAVARLTDSPLGISVSPEDEHFGERLELARWAPGAEVGICDWILSPAEVRVAQRSELRIIALGDSPAETD